MNRSSTPQRLGIYQQPKTFWLVRLIQSLALAASAYLVAVFSYLLIIHLSEMPRGPLWDESFRAPLAFVLIVIAALGLLIPYFQKEWDRGMRTFSVLSALFLLAFASLSTTHVADPKIPLQLITHYVIDPLRHLLKF